MTRRFMKHKQTAVEWLYNNLKSHFEHNGDLLEVVQMSFEQAKAQEKEQKHKSIDKQVSILKGTLEEMMTGFDSEEDKVDFILDICNGYKKRINL
jgi:hypothetical protein